MANFMTNQKHYQTLDSYIAIAIIAHPYCYTLRDYSS